MQKDGRAGRKPSGERRLARHECTSHQRGPGSYPQPCLCLPLRAFSCKDFCLTHGAQRAKGTPGTALQLPTAAQGVGQMHKVGVPLTEAE